MSKKQELRDFNSPLGVGLPFRTIQVGKCAICGALTNLAIFHKYPGGGTRYHCPNEKEKWHIKMQRKLHLLKDPHPKSYKQDLLSEINEIYNQNAHSIKNDLVGDPDQSQKIPFNKI